MSLNYSRNVLLVTVFFMFSYMNSALASNAKQLASNGETGAILCGDTNVRSFKTGFARLDRDWEYHYKAWITYNANCSGIATNKSADYIEFFDVYVGRNIVGGKTCRAVSICNLRHKVDNNIGGACMKIRAQINGILLVGNSCPNGIVGRSSGGGSRGGRGDRVRLIN